MAALAEQRAKRLAEENVSLSAEHAKGKDTFMEGGYVTKFYKYINKIQKLFCDMP